MDKVSKPKLSDVLGALVTSVAYGRSTADVGAIRIALNYYQNELLKGLPVPRLRMSRVSISLPLIISDVIQGNPAVASRPEKISKKVAEALKAAIENEKNRLDAQSYRLKASIENEKITEDQQAAIEIYGKFLNCWSEPWSHVDKNNKFKTGISFFEEELREQVKNSVFEMELAEGNTKPSDISIINTTVEVAEKTLRRVMSEAYYHLREKEIEKWDIKEEIKTESTVACESDTLETSEKLQKSVIDKYEEDWIKENLIEVTEEDYIEQLINKVRYAAEKEAVSSSTVPPDFYVVVNTESIKNAGGGPDVVTRLEMVLIEEGLEWTSEKQDGKETTKLMPE